MLGIISYSTVFYFKYSFPVQKGGFQKKPVSKTVPDAIKYMFMVVIGVYRCLPLKTMMPQNFTIASFEHPLSKS